MPIVKGSNEKLDDIIYSEAAAPARPNNFSRLKRALKILALIILMAVGGLAVSAGWPAKTTAPANNSADKTAGSWSWFSNFSLVGQLRQLAQSSGEKLKGEDRDRINILLLGIGGKNHDGGLLTDTIMLLSLKPSTKEAAFVSIPRDLSVPVEGMGWRKINSINAFAEKDNPGSGGLAVNQTVGHLLNMPIDYYLTVDFTGFIKIIDELGGLRVFVDNILDDYSYPILGREDNPDYYSRWEHLHVDAGWQQMDGALALKFARSRHGVGVEGSDFARSKRQQKILEAVKNQLLSLNVLFKPKLIASMVEAYRDHLATNLSVMEMAKLWSLFKDVKSNQIINKGLDNGPGGLLVDVTGEDGAYLLTPASGDFSQIEYMVKNIFNSAPLETKQKITKEEAAIEVRNGTWINGLANKAALDLEKYGFTVLYTGNSSQRNFQKSVIYDLTSGGKPESLALLKEKTGANIAYGLPDWLKADIGRASSTRDKTKQLDFVLILGEEASR
jgi:LCP family protein required for cell wall assembly